MTESAPRRPISLDDLVKSSKEQFDTIVASQMREIGLVAADRRSPPADCRGHRLGQHACRQW